MKQEDGTLKDFGFTPLTDAEMAIVISDIRDQFGEMKIPTLNQLTIFFNLTIGIFRVCSVCGDQKELLKVAKHFYTEVKKEIKKFEEK